jgi:hypothetical protein
MKNVSVGDYVVATIEEKKKLLLVDKKRSDGMLKTLLADHSIIDDPQTFVIEGDDVLANMGPNPEPGSAYGVRVEPCVGSVDIKPWGRVYFLRRLEKSERGAIKKQLKITGRFIQKLGLDSILPMQIAVKPKSGRWAGKYLYRPTPEDVDSGQAANDWMHLAPHQINRNYNEEQIFGFLPYVILHEFGHGIWYRKMTYALKAKWIKLYTKSKKRHRAELRQIQRLGQNFIASKATVRMFMKEISEDEQEVFNEILSYISTYHGLETKHLDTLVIAQRGKLIRRYWPRRPLTLVDDNPFVTEYATKNVEELFAEAFSHYYVKELREKVPANVRKLLLRTLKAVGAKV